MIKLTIKNMINAVLVRKFFSIECQNCKHITHYRIISPIICSSCLTSLPEASKLLHMSQNRYNYFKSNVETI